ncbi:hypothetical protein B9Z55_021570 [Caenorhabditis nigoni]|uniref:F-box domain-containing protein n=1 Tax=Caenorhabditis nigoni TaxID=1611254 RepID=A0A2G5TSH9_9PELO|nr:hypothetical protein B9Z55_021570 [Caenorhabditis nigoni]
MPIRLLSLPAPDLQYALNCMDICDLIAFSLCSKQTKNLVKSSNRKIQLIFADIDEKCIRINIWAKNQKQKDESIFFNFYDSWLEIDRHRRKITFWTKQEFTRSDWIAHFMNIFKVSMIQRLVIGNVRLSYLDTVKQIIPKCQTLLIREHCSNNVARMTFLKLSPIVVDTVEVETNIFDKENDLSKFLTLNLRSAIFHDWLNPFELKLEDLLTLNIVNLIFGATIITESELNRFLKLWLKKNHGFYRPKDIKLFFERKLNREEVLRGIKHEIAGYEARLKRRDGKELEVYIAANCICFKFL